MCVSCTCLRMCTMLGHQCSSNETFIILKNTNILVLSCSTSSFIWNMAIYQCDKLLIHIIPNYFQFCNLNLNNFTFFKWDTLPKKAGRINLPDKSRLNFAINFLLNSFILGDKRLQLFSIIGNHNFICWDHNQFLSAFSFLSCIFFILFHTLQNDFFFKSAISSIIFWKKIQAIFITLSNHLK